MPSRNPRRFVVALLGIAWCMAALPTPAAPRYSATPITLGGQQAWVAGINSSGDATGWGYTAGLCACGYIYSGGSARVIGTPGGTMLGYAINDGGQVAGGGSNHAMLYSSGALTDLGTLGGTRSYGYGISSVGNVVGEAQTAGDGATHAFLYSTGTMADLGTLGGKNSGAYAINSSGQIVGWSDTSGDLARHAFLHSGGSMVDLGTLGGTNSSASAINASGQVVGGSDTTGNVAQHAFLYSGGVMHDLGGSTRNALGMNNLGHVVGTTGAAAFLYMDGTVYDLNALVVSGLGAARLLNAFGINDNGQIVANSCDIPGGGPKPCSAYRLDPLPQTTAVPASSAWSLGILAALLALSTLLAPSARRGRRTRLPTRPQP